MDRVQTPLDDYRDRATADRALYSASGFGVDVASQRQDALDSRALETIHKHLMLGADPVTVLDLGCGLGGFARRAVRAGASVVAVDKHPQTSDHIRMIEGATGRYQFVAADMRSLSEPVTQARYHVIMCQRTLSYLPYREALSVLRVLQTLLRPQGRLYTSFSGLFSELAYGYADAQSPIQERFSRLSPDMRAKHGITEPLCLYTADEAIDVLHQAEFGIQDVGVSPFWNVKVEAYA